MTVLTMLYHFNEVQYKNETSNNYNWQTSQFRLMTKNDCSNNFGFYELKYYSPDEIINDNVDKDDANRWKVAHRNSHLIVVTKPYERH